MKDEIPKTEQDKNEIKNSHLSMNTGITSCAILFYAVIRDFLILFGIEIKWLNCIFGMIVLILYFAIVKKDLSDKVKNKKNLRNAIDIIIPFMDNLDKCDKIIAIIIISTLLCLYIIVLGWTFFFKSDRKCNTD